MQLSMKKWHCDHRFQREKLPTYENLHEFLAYLGGIASKPRPISTERCSTDLTDLIDIFTVDRLCKVKKKSIISAQTDEAGLRYRARKF